MKPVKLSHLPAYKMGLSLYKDFECISEEAAA